MKAMDVLPDILMSESQIKGRCLRAGCAGMFDAWLFTKEIEEYLEYGTPVEYGGSGLAMFYRLVTPELIKFRKQKAELKQKYGS